VTHFPVLTPWETVQVKIATMTMLFGHGYKMISQVVKRLPGGLGYWVDRLKLAGWQARYGETHDIKVGRETISSPLLWDVGANGAIQGDLPKTLKNRILLKTTTCPAIRSQKIDAFIEHYNHEH